MKTKLNNEIRYIPLKERKSYKQKREERNRFLAGLTFCLIVIAVALWAFANFKVVSKDPVAITDSYVDCVNLGQCEDLTVDTDTASVHIEESKEAKALQESKGNSKLGELITHKGVYVNSAIINAIDNKFTPAEAKKLKTIMLAECAMDYKIDGVVTYECKSTTQNYNKDSKTWDCGYLQINQKTPCSAKSFEIAYQIESAYNKLNSINGESCGGFNCWSSYKFRNSKVIKTAYNMWNSKNEN